MWSQKHQEHTCLTHRWFPSRWTETGTVSGVTCTSLTPLSTRLCTLCSVVATVTFWKQSAWWSSAYTDTNSEVFCFLHHRKKWFVKIKKIKNKKSYEKDKQTYISFFSFFFSFSKQLILDEHRRQTTTKSTLSKSGRVIISGSVLVTECELDKPVSHKGGCHPGKQRHVPSVVLHARSSHPSPHISLQRTP